VGRDGYNALRKKENIWKSIYSPLSLIQPRYAILGKFGQFVWLRQSGHAGARRPAPGSAVCRGHLAGQLGAHELRDSVARPFQGLGSRAFYALRHNIGNADTTVTQSRKVEVHANAMPSRGKARGKGASKGQLGAILGAKTRDKGI